MAAPSPSATARSTTILCNGASARSFVVRLAAGRGKTEATPAARSSRTTAT
jgi:hypothetical protein